MNGCCSFVVPVYPRGCGGTKMPPVSLPPNKGLSPRVRGNLGNTTWQTLCTGSIPAGAGEPPTALPPITWAGVYPRGCGGTDRQHHLADAVHRVYPRGCGGTPDGLPPITWAGVYPRGCGGTDRVFRPFPSEGSIPAGAGEPCGVSPLEAPFPVYPRGCGGTSKSVDKWITRTGLSPRVRGNRGPVSIATWNGPGCSKLELTHPSGSSGSPVQG